MVEIITQVVIPIAFILTSAFVGYEIGNWKAKNDMKLERRTEIFEDILRATSKLVDNTIVEKGIEDRIMNIKESGIRVLLEAPKEDGSLILNEMRDDLKSRGMDEEDVDNFLANNLRSLLMVMQTNIGIGIIDAQTQLNEEVMALGMYISPKMKKNKSYENLKNTAEKFNDTFRKFEKDKVTAEVLRERASELSSSINEIMKFN